MKSDPEQAEDLLREIKQLNTTTLQEVRESVSALRSDPLQGKTLGEAIALVHKGYTQIGPGLATQVLTQPPPATPSPVTDPEDLKPWLALSEREKDIVRLVAQGYSNREISQSLHIAEKTVKNYLTNILSQLDLRDRTQLAIASLKGGFHKL